MTGFRVVVPARYGSSRLPAKALAPIAGKPLVVHVWEKAIASGTAVRQNFLPVSPIHYRWS